MSPSKIIRPGMNLRISPLVPPLYTTRATCDHGVDVLLYSGTRPPPYKKRSVIGTRTSGMKFKRKTDQGCLFSFHPHLHTTFPVTILLNPTEIHPLLPNLLTYSPHALPSASPFQLIYVCNTCASIYVCVCVCVCARARVFVCSKGRTRESKELWWRRRRPRRWQFRIPTATIYFRAEHTDNSYK
jgi:hypothetical protein